MRSVVTALAAVLALLAPSLSSSHGDGGADRKPGKPAMAPEQKAFGREGDPRRVARTITIRMSDSMRYEPAEIRVRQGETVRLVGANDGKALHEIVIGTTEELKEHAELMRRHPGMEHDEPYMAHVKPGARQSIVWEFNQPGEFRFGCLVPGHFEAGMAGRIVVTAR